MPAETTSFVGRRHELAEARKKLATARLISLVGPGGVGKTRLAIRIATDLGRGFPDGAWLAAGPGCSFPCSPRQLMSRQWLR